MLFSVYISCVEVRPIVTVGLTADLWRVNEWSVMPTVMIGLGWSRMEFYFFNTAITQCEKDLVFKKIIEKRNTTIYREFNKLKKTIFSFS